ncbi:hypothetical protein SK128_001660, partial [Halocaridina rubra]
LDIPCLGIKFLDYNGYMKSQEVTQFLSILQGHFTYDNVLLVLDSGAQQFVENPETLNKGYFGSSITIVSTENIDEFKQKGQVSLLRGRSLTALVIFTKNILPFFDYLALDHVWNPRQLLLMSLNAIVGTTDILRHDVVQRSEKITLFQRKELFYGPKYFLYTMIPFEKHNAKEATKKWFGTWTGATTFLTEEALFPERFRNFEGVSLYLSSWCDDYPYLYRHNVTCTGSNIELLNMIASKLNFTYVVQDTPADEIWGSKENGTWTGMYGDLLYQNKNLAINSIFLRADVYQDFDYTVPYISAGFGIALRKPKSLPQWQGLFRPFTLSMWFATAVTVLFVTSTLTLILHVLSVGQESSRMFLMVRKLN